MPTKANVCSLLAADIDWFTCTIEGDLRTRFAESKGEAILKEQEVGGFTRTNTNRFGYVGERVDGFFCGRKEKQVLVIGSGDLARAQAPFFLGLATNVTRLDLAVTLRDDDPKRDWTLIAQKEVQRDAKVESGYLKTHRIEGTPDGRTLYIGSRSSDRYIRIYDKTAESKGTYEPTSWRWEIEYKRPRSGMVAARLLRHGFSEGEVLDTVASALANVQVRLPVDHDPSGWIPVRHKRPTNDETRLKYAARVIGPFLKNLVANVGEDRVAQALDRSAFTRRRVISQSTGEILK